MLFTHICPKCKKQYEREGVPDPESLPCPECTELEYVENGLHFHFIIPGEPITGGTTKVMMGKKGRPVFFKPKGYAESIKWIQDHVKEQLPTGFKPLQDVPLEVFVAISKVKPDSWPKKRNVPLKRPDCGNYEKPILDALGSKRYGHILYVDDACVVDLRIKKVFGDKPETVIDIWPLNIETGDRLAK